MSIDSYPGEGLSLFSSLSPKRRPALWSVNGPSGRHLCLSMVACNFMLVHCFIKGVNGKSTPRATLTLHVLFYYFWMYFIYKKMRHPHSQYNSHKLDFPPKISSLETSIEGEVTG